MFSIQICVMRALSMLSPPACLYCVLAPRKHISAAYLFPVNISLRRTCSRKHVSEAYLLLETCLCSLQRTYSLATCILYLENMSLRRIRSLRKLYKISYLNFGGHD